MSSDLLWGLALGVLLPGLLTGGVLLFLWQPWREKESRPGWAAPLAIGLGYGAGHLGLRWPDWPHQYMDVSHWLFYGAGVALLPAILDGAWKRRPAWLVPGILFLALGAFIGLTLKPRIQWAFSTTQTVLWVGGTLFVTMGLWTALEALSRKEKGAPLPLTLTLTTGAAAAASAMTGSLLIGQLGGAVAATLGAVTILAFWTGTVRLGRGAMIPVTLLHVGVLLNALFYAELPTSSALLLFAAPATAWLGRAPKIRNLSPLLRTLVLLAPVLLLIGLAMGLGYASLPEPDPGGAGVPRY